jgi:hypothetical protein
MPCTADYLRNRYCDGSFTECARFIIYTKYGMDKVPKFLFPDDIYLARRNY